MNSTDSTITVTEYLGGLKDCLFVKLSQQVGIVVSRTGDYCGTAASQDSPMGELYPGDRYLTSNEEEIEKAIADFLEKEKSQTKIYVTEYLGGLKDCLFVRVSGSEGIVVSRQGQFRGTACGEKTHLNKVYNDLAYRTLLRPDVKEAIANFSSQPNYSQDNKKLLERIESLEKDVSNMTKLLEERREVRNPKESLKVVEYTGDESCINCVYVSSPDCQGRVVSLVMRKHIGYARSSDTKIFNSKPWEECHGDILKAIDEYLLTKPGDLQQGEVKVRRTPGSSRRLVVNVCGLGFLVNRDTREVVPYSGSGGIKTANKDYFARLDKAVKFSSAVDSYMRGLRGVIQEEKTLKTILEPFKQKYLTYLEKKKESSGNMYFVIIGKISSCLATKDLQVILDAYPAFSHGESIRTALVELYGEL